MNKIYVTESNWMSELAALAREVEQAPAKTSDTPELAWINANLETSRFAQSLKQFYDRQGHLTEKQLEAVRRNIQLETSAATFDQDHAAEIAWVRENAPINSFAASLLDYYTQHRVLTGPQLSCVRRSLLEAEGLRMQPAHKDAASLDISPLPAGRYAVPHGTTRLKVKIERPTQGAYAGHIFVSDCAVYGTRRRYGRQAPGSKIYVGQIRDELAQILANPKEAMAEYGRLTGTCGLCGRPLEDAESVARGIGPICAARMG